MPVYYSNSYITQQTHAPRFRNGVIYVNNLSKRVKKVKKNPFVAIVTIFGVFLHKLIFEEKNKKIEKRTAYTVKLI